ncbi:acyltransferase [Lutibacter holmesii]|uniref:Acyltransferase n=1 Tax=Lutibacter holmesii TaxID=1137985 RepID=A0ABW3WRM4_9FLAO
MENREVLKKNYSLKRVFRKAIMFIASKFPFMPGNLRARLFKMAGVKFTNVKTNFIGYNVYFDDLNPELITVGENTIITEGTKILSHFLDVSYDDFDHQYLGNVFIDCNVFIGMNTVITKPISIGKGAIIGANSVVTMDIKPYTINGGVPAKFIKERKIYKK